MDSRFAKIDSKAKCATSQVDGRTRHRGNVTITEMHLAFSSTQQKLMTAYTENTIHPSSSITFNANIFLQWCEPNNGYQRNDVQSLSVICPLDLSPIIRINPNVYANLFS